jgi:hypothetical protein
MLRAYIKSCSHEVAKHKSGVYADSIWRYHAHRATTLGRRPRKQTTQANFSTGRIVDSLDTRKRNLVKPDINAIRKPIQRNTQANSSQDTGRIVDSLTRKRNLVKPGNNAIRKPIPVKTLGELWIYSPENETW